MIRQLSTYLWDETLLRVRDLRWFVPLSDSVLFSIFLSIVCVVVQLRTGPGHGAHVNQVRNSNELRLRRMELKVWLLLRRANDNMRGPVGSLRCNRRGSPLRLRFGYETLYVGKRRSRRSDDTGLAESTRVLVHHTLSPRGDKSVTWARPDHINGLIFRPRSTQDRLQTSGHPWRYKRIRVSITTVKRFQLHFSLTISWLYMVDRAEN